MSSSGITFIPNFMKIGSLVHKLKRDTHIHTGSLVIPHAYSFPFKEEM